MIIPISIPQASSSSAPSTLPPQLAQFGTDELVLIELQGALEFEGDSAGERVVTLSVDVSGVRPHHLYLHLSTLVIFAHERTRHTQKKSTLRIGHHLLEGKLVPLAKPLAVLHRLPEASLCRTSDPGAGETEAGWEVRALVKRKMVFARRPMPIVEHRPAVSSFDMKRAKK